MLMAMEENLSWWPLPAWMSPGAALFLFCNVLVGAIVVTSRGEQAASTRRFCRSASSMVLGRLRSFSMFSGHPVSFEEGYHPSLELEAEEEEEHQPAAAEPAVPAAPAASAPAAAASATSESAAAEEVGGGGAGKVIVIGCSSLRGGGGELGTLKT